jgi:phosphatidylglycerophosphatase A
MTFSLCLIGIPWLEWPAFLAIAFIVSRIMDIIKPPPARESQALASGIGIVMDDVLANIYALIVNHLIWRYAIVKFVLATT